jgi:prevent-host-death family protein
MSDRKSATTRTAEATTALPPTDGTPVTAGVRELRDDLSHYLGIVRERTSVTVIDHGAPIGTIVPMRFTERTMELYRQGRVNLPTLPKGVASTFRLTEVEGGIQDILREVRGD